MGVGMFVPHHDDGADVITHLFKQKNTAWDAWLKPGGLGVSGPQWRAGQGAQRK